MVLVDTSVRVAHLRDGNTRLRALLVEGRVLCHPYVIGELSCGNLRKRDEILALLQALPQAVKAYHEEVLQFIQRHRLMGTGLGYIDMHLLASSFLSDARLWTLDGKLDSAAREFGRAFE